MEDVMLEHLRDPLKQVRREFRGVHLSEDTVYRYGVVLSQCVKVEKDAAQPQRPETNRHLEIVQNLTRAGLDVTVLQPTADSKDKVVLLVNATKPRLLMEWKRLTAERYVYNNADSMVAREAAYEDSDAADAFDEIQMDRPAWHRDDPVRGVVQDANYDDTKWESERELTYADEVLCLKRIITGEINPMVGSHKMHEVMSSTDPNSLALFTGAGILTHMPQNERPYPIVETVFPLHDDRFVNEFLALLNPREELRISEFLGEDWFVDEMRYHFGERIAYYFAFQQLYTAWLKPIALGGLFLWIVFCVFGPSAILYWRVITIFGFGISTIWTPAMLKAWQQRVNQLNARWGLENWNDDLDPNPHFDWGPHKENSVVIRRQVDEFQARQTFFRFAKPETKMLDYAGFKRMCEYLPGFEHISTDSETREKFGQLDINQDGELELSEFMTWVHNDSKLNEKLGMRALNPPFRRWWNMPLSLFVLFVFGLVFFILNLGFVYWYVYGVLVDVCEDDDTRSWPSCFNTQSAKLLSGRWCYIALQGVALGIFLDIILEGIVTSLVEKHSRVENLPTLKAQEDHFVSHVFGYLWMGWFMWFVLLAFVYIPFGNWIQASQKLILGEKWVNDWVPGLIAMDTAMVTPLIVTQLLKLLTDTFIPYMVRRLMEKAKLRPDGPLNLGTPIKLADLAEFSRVIEDSPAPASVAETDKLLAPNQPPASVELMHAIKDDSELAARVYVVSSMPTWEFDKTQSKMRRMWKTATHMVEESRRGEFNFFSEMLRPVIQFSYVTNFTVVWPLTPLCAFLNNLFEVRGDTFKMLVTERRSIPRKVNGIGAWYGCLIFAAIAGIFFMVGMITVASSGLEAFVGPEKCGLHEDDWVMRPNIGCLDNGGVTRVVWALVLEHLALLILFLVYNGVQATSADVKQNIVRKYMEHKMEFEDHWLIRAARRKDV